MAEYIEREVALRAITYNPLAKPEPNDIIALTLLTAQKRIMKIPAADVAPVVHSEWINHSGGNATCRRCGVRQRAVYDDDNDQNFCGHCGAKMDGGGHGN